MNSSKIKFSFMTTAMLLQALSREHGMADIADLKKLYKEILKTVSDAGIHTVEITTLELELFGKDYVRKILAGNHLTAGGMVHFDTFAVVNKEEAGHIIEKACRAVDEAESLGVKIVMLALAVQEDISGYSMEELATALAENIRPIAVYGKTKGIRVCVEDTPEVTLPLCSIDETRALLDAVPELYLAYDSGNMLIKHENPVSYYEAFRERICHIHLKDMAYVPDEEPGDMDISGKKMRGAIHGQGIVDFCTLANCMEQNGYQGYAVIEYTALDNHYRNIKDAVAYFEKCFGKRV
ncbi:hypothetical protein GCM10008910_04580 [Faecalicatena orotica]|uniref:Sugar phosphate isomerase/epimerase n=1 Tax=Faecalicatena orotica TaxID=1544 RepID=A0A2Y9BHB9_9FIRM|nr:sugar phosphate isomerase/epimerase family protein [Faecalicatena orotica]PWJ30873.1 sugar phosphate isomerase/epimerase [Faecalicatena orotica]SSA55034.1 Sugar phosphate isomerase/epimerase [Faecalicatena orotica]